MPPQEFGVSVMAGGEEIREDKTQPFEMGVAAARSKMSRDANPFEPKTDAYSDWNAGYEAFKDADDDVRPDAD